MASLLHAWQWAHVNHRTTDQNSLSFHSALTLTEMVRATQLCLCLSLWSDGGTFLYSWVEYLGTFRSAPVHSSPPVQSWTVHRSFFCQVPGTTLGHGRAISDLKAVGLSCVLCVTTKLGVLHTVILRGLLAKAWTSSRPDELLCRSSDMVPWSRSYSECSKMDWPWRSLLLISHAYGSRAYGGCQAWGIPGQ